MSDINLSLDNIEKVKKVENKHMLFMGNIPIKSLEYFLSYNSLTIKDILPVYDGKNGLDIFYFLDKLE